MLINNPNHFIAKLRDNKQQLSEDDSFDFDENDQSLINSLKESRNLSMIPGNLNLNNNNINNFNNNFDDIIENRNIHTGGVINYSKCQAYVYENLHNSNLFKQIDWKNLAKEDEKGTEIIINQNRYKVKRAIFPYDFEVKTHNNKIFNICVKRGDIPLNSNGYIQFKFKINQWNLFAEHQNPFILAFVNIRNNNNNNPEIYYARKGDLINLV